MIEPDRLNPPAGLAALLRDTHAVGFTMASDVWTGALLRTLAAGKPRGAFLEVGTGTGLATAWLLDGMDAESTLLSVDTDEAVLSIARRHLGADRRLSIVMQDGGDCLRALRAEGRAFDLVFADAMLGKYAQLDDALALVKRGGFYVIDDMLPQPNWPDDHPPKVKGLLAALAARSDLRLTPLSWSTGVVVAARIA